MEGWNVLVRKGHFNFAGDNEEINVHLRLPGFEGERGENYCNLSLAVEDGEHLQDIERWPDVVWEVIRLWEGRIVDYHKWGKRLREWITTKDNEDLLLQAWALRVLPGLEAKAKALNEKIADVQKIVAGAIAVER